MFARTPSGDANDDRMGLSPRGNGPDVGRETGPHGFRCPPMIHRRDNGKTDAAIRWHGKKERSTCTIASSIERWISMQTYGEP